MAKSAMSVASLIEEDVHNGATGAVVIWNAKWNGVESVVSRDRVRLRVSVWNHVGVIDSLLSSASSHCRTQQWGHKEDCGEHFRTASL